MSWRRASVRTGSVVALLCLWVAPAAGASEVEPTPLLQPARHLVRQLAARQVGEVDAASRFLQPAFQVHADGYLVTVIGIAPSVAVVVERGRHAATGYVVRGAATRGRLQASFGKLGEISMRFRPSANRSWVHPHRSCHGRHALLVRRGVYLGDFRFRAEGGYVSIHVHRAKGEIGETAPQCLRRAGARGRLAQSTARHLPRTGEPAEPAFLTAFWRHGISATQFVAFQGRHGKNDFLFETETSKGRMAIISLALLFGAGGTFTHDDALTTARVAPPPPFHGAGTYRAAPDGTKTWRGQLSVSLPGTARLPLTGSPFEVKFGTVPISLF